MQDKDRAPKIIHPFLISIYPVLALLAHNIEEMEPVLGLRAVALSLGAAGILLLMLKPALRDWARAALIGSLILGFFFSYGHIYNAIEGLSLFGAAIGRHRYLFPLWMGSFVLATWLANRSAESKGTVRPLNIFAAVLLLFPVIQIGTFAVRSASLQVAEGDEAHSTLSLQPAPDQPLPDIYYIILDGYARDDVLVKDYQFDNNPFLDSLRESGFYVASCSQSNYAQTQLSLASSLNFQYLDALGEQYRPGNTSRVGLGELIQHSAARQALESLGYTTVAFETGYDATQIEDAGEYLAGKVDLSVNDFENMLIRSTAARVLSEGVAFLNLKPDWEARDQAHRERVLFTLERLREIPDIAGPKFVFAHIINPHWPHVFGPDGEPVHEHPDSKDGYRNQVIFINRQIDEILGEIMQRSSTPPIIILQGDHGSVIESPRMRMSILNAYHLPAGGNSLLYESISPVNTFRLIFSYYFGANLPFLDDESLYSTYELPYDFERVPESRPGCPED